MVMRTGIGRVQAINGALGVQVPALLAERTRAITSVLREEFANPVGVTDRPPTGALHPQLPPTESYQHPLGPLACAPRIAKLVRLSPS